MVVPRGFKRKISPKNGLQDRLRTYKSTTISKKTKKMAQPPLLASWVAKPKTKYKTDSEALRTHKSHSNIERKKSRIFGLILSPAFNPLPIGAINSKRFKSNLGANRTKTPTQNLFHTYIFSTFFFSFGRHPEYLMHRREVLIFDHRNYTQDFRSVSMK